MKKALFFENAILLAKGFEIVPLMYGSVGLEYITGERLHADDIDILVPEAYVTDKWDEFKAFLAGEGYALVDEREHTFKKDEVFYAYAAIEELEEFAGIKLNEIKQVREAGAEFKLLSLKQYLKVYSASAKDGYRVNVRQKKDSEKIALIERLLKK